MPVTGSANQSHLPIPAWQNDSSFGPWTSFVHGLANPSALRRYDIAKRSSSAAQIAECFGTVASVMYRRLSNDPPAASIAYSLARLSALVLPFPPATSAVL